MSSTTLPVCPKTGSTSPSLTVHLCLHTVPGNRECALRDAIDQHYADLGEYPRDLHALVSGRYLRSIPEDPVTRSSATWVVVPAEPDPAEPFVQGVYDVRSGSEAIALDGTVYADW